MNINSLHYDFKTKFDKVDSTKRRNFLPAQIDWLLNEAAILFTNEIYKKYEETQSTIDDLATITINSPEEQPFIVPTNNNGVYKFSSSSFLFKYKHLVRLRAEAAKTGCGTKVIKCVPKQHDDLSDVLESPFEDPSYEWRRIPYTQAKNSTTFGDTSFYLYTNNKFTITKVYPEYIKIPRRCFFGGYNSLDGQYVIGDPQVTLDLPESVHERVVDIAVREAAREIAIPNFEVYNQKTITNN